MFLSSEGHSRPGNRRSGRFPHSLSNPPLLTLLLLFLLILSFPAKAFSVDRWVIGLGGGYAFPYEQWIKRNTSLSRGEIFFEEEGRLKNSFYADVQYYLTPLLGFELEYSFQQAGYFNHLDWYGKWVSVPPPMYEKFLEINHMEEPQTNSWSVHSVIASLLFTYRKRKTDALIMPYLSLGAGIHFLKGDRERVLQRFRLGPARSGGIAKVGVGMKYRLTKKLWLNLRAVLHTLNRKYGKTTYLATDPEQFDFQMFMNTGEIVRIKNALARTFTYIGIDIGFEFTLGSGQKTAGAPEEKTSSKGF